MMSKMQLCNLYCCFVPPSLVLQQLHLFKALHLKLAPPASFNISIGPICLLQYISGSLCLFQYFYWSFLPLSKHKRVSSLLSKLCSSQPLTLQYTHLISNLPFLAAVWDLPQTNTLSKGQCTIQSPFHGRHGLSAMGPNVGVKQPQGPPARSQIPKTSSF